MTMGGTASALVTVVLAYVAYRSGWHLGPDGLAASLARVTGGAHMPTGNSSEPLGWSMNAKLWIPTRKQGHLNHVKNAFQRASYTIVEDEHDWDVMWTFHNPFYPRKGEADLPSMMKTLKPQQRVNHLPGASYFTSKLELAKRAEQFDFVPSSYVMPQDHSELMKKHEALLEAGEESVWVQKSNKHRGVEVVDVHDPQLNSSDAEIFVQQLIRPHLVDGRMFDVGMYVAITSVEPLRAYLYDNVLMRHCTQNYTRDIATAPVESYVVADNYSPPWALPSLRPFYTWGMSTLNVLRAYFCSIDVDPEPLVREMERQIAELLVAYAPRMAKSAQRYPHGQASFFSMYRVDFIIDEQLRPWLTEVNQSPNLSSAYTRDLKDMFRRLSYSLLHLAGLTPGGYHHAGSKKPHQEVLVHAADIDIGATVCHACRDSCSADPHCIICRRCRTPPMSAALKGAVAEHRSKQGFMRLWPPSGALKELTRDLAVDSGSDRMLRAWVTEKCLQDASWC